MVNGADQEGLVPLEPSPRWWLRGGVAPVTAVALVRGGLEVHGHAFVRCADGVREQGPGDVRVGVTGGRFVSDPSPAEVSRKIAEENRRAADPGDRDGKPLALAEWDPRDDGAYRYPKTVRS